MSDDLEEGTVFTPDFGKIRKICASVKTDVMPVAVQNAETGEILIIAYVNREALEYTVKNGIAAFWSTSRNELWVKGKSSGNYLEVVDILVNCEQNSLVYKVRVKGEGACHTRDETGKHRMSCYYRRLVPGSPDKLEFIGKR